MDLKQIVTALTFSVFVTSSIATEPWLSSGRIGGTYVYKEMPDAELTALLDQREAEHVSILELDSRLSYYMSDQEFDAELTFLNRVAQQAHDRGMKAVVYYPTLEVLTKDGVTAESTMAKDHPNWLQYGIDGTPNVFYGGQEVWVSPGEESAWMSPNTGYRNYFLDRIEKLAASTLDGVWLDVPIYLDTGTPWTGAEPDAASEFEAWTQAQGLNGGIGFSVPPAEDMGDPGFLAWLKWRHINLALFLDDVRAAAHRINPAFAVVIENFPMDYFDGTAYGLDPSYLTSTDNLLHVWETDSVSNTQAMKWASPDDFENKIAMLKWGRAYDRNQPSWSFSYGYEPLDAGLTLAATVATRHVPFESQTPTMLTSVGSDFRRNWFGYIKDHETELFATQREPEVGIWYSSTTRDFQDYGSSGRFGMYSVTTPPVADDTWWAARPEDSVVTASHLGGYRGMSAAMMRLHIPYSVIHSRNDGTSTTIEDIDLLLLPSVGSLSDSDATAIRQFVQNGGVLLATGDLPGTLDENGTSRTQSNLADLFEFPAAPANRVNRFGQGLAIYRADVYGSTLFGDQLDNSQAADTLSELERLVRIHVDEPLTLENGEDIYVDRAIADDNRHLLYLVNYGGLQLPLVQSVKSVTVQYRVPGNKRIVSVLASSPNLSGENGFATITNRGYGLYEIDVSIDQFALLDIRLEDATVPVFEPYAGPQFEDAAHAEAAQSGLDFVLSRMRNDALPEPNRFGVHTNLLDNEDSTEIYTNGHNVTGEHMGLLLRTAACMNDEVAFNEAYQYIAGLMSSPLYRIPNWSIDKNTQEPFVFFDDFNNNWFNANAPLDDLRLVHGLIDGHENFNHVNANTLADAMLEGLYWTSITDRSRNPLTHLFTSYPGGLLGFAWDWAETDNESLTPPATASGTGYLGTELLPVDYQDLGTLVHAAQRDPRWDSVLQATTRLLLDSENNLSGLFFNGYRPDGSWTGDFEYQGNRRGEHLKTIQTLWTAIHLARVSKSPTNALSGVETSLADAAARRSLEFFRTFYQNQARVPEYLTTDGLDVPDCTNGIEGNCLSRGTENLFGGEARIYAQLARLALLLGDKPFANRVINEKIITDRIADTGDPRYGMIGVSTAGTNDAEAWNILESVYSLCLGAISEDEGEPPVDNNNPPTAVSDTFSTNEETPLTLDTALLLANDTDPDGDILTLAGVANRSDQGNSISALPSGGWRYIPATGFSGPDTISYAISDGRGGNAIGQIEIVVNVVPKTLHNAESITIATGTLDYGSVTFLTDSDENTYDINAVATDGSYVVDWSITARVPNPEQVTRLQVSYSGHYSIPAVTQETLLYNHQTNTWISFDTRVVGDQSDSVVQLDVTDSLSDFIAPDGESRLRIIGTHGTQAPTVWANSVSWTAHRGAQGNTNAQPLAADISASTTVNMPVNLTLSASNSGSESLTYNLNSAGMTGTLSGSAPDLVYTPTTGFTGTDSFTYTVTDGAVESATGTVTVNVLPQGIISNLAAAITLDGDLVDWSGYIAFPDDPTNTTAASGPLDWYRAWMAHDGASYYIAFINQGPISASWGQTIYLDIDENASTGYQNGLPMGADRVIQGRFIYKYTGNGNDWQWEFMTEAVGTSDNGKFEYRFPRSTLDDTDSIRLGFYGTNEAYGGSAEDLYPDGMYTDNAAIRFFDYTAIAPSNTAPDAQDRDIVAQQNVTTALSLPVTDPDGDALTYYLLSQPQHGVITGNPPELDYQPDTGYTGEDSFTYQAFDGQSLSRVATINLTVEDATSPGLISNPVSNLTIDGDFADWLTITPFDNDADDIQGSENPVDYLTAAMAHDTSYLYLTFTNDGQLLSQLDDWLFTVYIDSDQSAASGYTGGMGIGADYMQQGTAVYQYTGNGDNWSWQAVALSLRQTNDTRAEISIPRQILGDPSVVRLALIGDNFSAGGGLEDLYPDGIYSSTASVRYLEYSTGGTPSEPVVLAALEDVPEPVSGRQTLMQNAVQPERASNTVASGKSSGSGIGLAGPGALVFLLMCSWRRSRENHVL